MLSNIQNHLLVEPLQNVILNKRIHVIHNPNSIRPIYNIQENQRLLFQTCDAKPNSVFYDNNIAIRDMVAIAHCDRSYSDILMISMISSIQTFFFLRPYIFFFIVDTWTIYFLYCKLYTIYLWIKIRPRAYINIGPIEEITDWDTDQRGKRKRQQKMWHLNR